MPDQERALIIGVGPGLSASLARLFTREGMTCALASRHPEHLNDLAGEITAKTYQCDVSDPASVNALFGDAARDLGGLDVVVFNPSARARGPLVELDDEAVRKSLLVSCYGGYLTGKAAAKIMTEQGHGSILFTGASASVKGYARSAPFAMGKFGLRGLAQSMARELAPENIHVAHFVIDGSIMRVPEDARSAGRDPDSFLHPDHIAETYLHVHRQHRSAWTWEVELRPYVENF